MGKEALEVERRKLGDENALTLAQMFNLAVVDEVLGREDDADALLLETLEHQRKVFGEKNPTTALSIYTQGGWAAKRGQHDRAIALLQQSFESGLDSATIADVERDANLKSLRSDTRFTQLLDSARINAGKNP